MAATCLKKFGTGEQKAGKKENPENLETSLQAWDVAAHDL